ncbi:MAG: hypothetical protein AAFQ41_05870 [Cyanobacteria bacterium J06623_7]
MSNYSSTARQAEQYLRLWIYFIPVLGVVPALWTLYRSKNSNSVELQNNPLEDYSQLQQQQKASRQSVTLTLVWLSSYLLCFYGAGHGTEILAFRFLYANAITTTGYFVACTFLMSRLGKKKLFSRDEMN